MPESVTSLVGIDQLAEEHLRSLQLSPQPAAALYPLGSRRSRIRGCSQVSRGPMNLSRPGFVGGSNT